MTAHRTTPEAAVLVALDVAMHRDEISVQKPARVRRRRLTALNARADHDQLITLLRVHSRPVLIGFEATGSTIGRSRSGCWRRASSFA